MRRDGRRIKARLGVVPQEDNLDPDPPVRQSLFVYARYFDIPARVARERIDEALGLFQLQVLAWFLPVSHVVTIQRGLVEGDLHWSHLGDLAWILVVGAVFFRLAIFLMRRRLIK